MAAPGADTPACFRIRRLTVGVAATGVGVTRDSFRQSRCSVAPCAPAPSEVRRSGRCVLDVTILDASESRVWRVALNAGVVFFAEIEQVLGNTLELRSGGLQK